MYELAPNTTLCGGKYRIKSKIAQGGFGITYLAEMNIGGNMNINVAVKEFFIKQEHYRDANGITVCCSNNREKSIELDRWKKKFKRETEVMMSVCDSSIVKVIELFEENSTAYYSMEHIDGCNLDDYVPAHGFSEVDSIQLIADVARAVKVLHDRNILHLDLNPRNIMRRTDGSIVLIDFGLSKVYDEDHNLKNTSVTIGGFSPGFAPIEQEDFDGTFTPTLDIYALGANFYKMLTGEKPPKATKLMMGLQPLEDKMKAKGISNKTIDIVTKAMQFQPTNRYQTIDDFLKALPKDKEPEIIETVEEETNTRTQPSSSYSYEATMREENKEGNVPYAVFENGTLTFYYGKNKPKGTYGMRDSTWHGDNEWGSIQEKIIKVVFDQSFKDYRPTSCAYWFYRCGQLSKIIGMRDYLNTSEVTDMKYMFSDCVNLTSLDVSGFKTDKVTDMSRMFYKCYNLTILDVSGFKTDKVTDMSDMFYRCQTLTSLDVSSFTTDKVTDMSYLFSYCDNLKTIYGGTWNTENVEFSKDKNMFENCVSLVGGKGTKFNNSYTNKVRARIDGGGLFSKGYFTEKNH